MAELGYNPEEYQNDEFTPIPAGRYRVFIDQVSIVELKNYAGKGARVQFKVMDGAFQKRLLSSLYSIYHTEPEKQKMARQMFARLCRAACGTPIIRDTDELVGHQLIAEVEVNGDYNNVKKVYPVEGSSEKPRPESPAGGMAENAPRGGASPATGEDAGSPNRPAREWNQDECPF